MTAHPQAGAPVAGERERKPQVERRFVTYLESDLPKTIMSGILANRTTFSVRVDGPFDLAQLDCLIALMQAQRIAFTEELS